MLFRSSLTRKNMQEQRGSVSFVVESKTLPAVLRRPGEAQDF